MLGPRGNIVGQLPNGQTILFSRDSPHLSMLAPSQEVECHVVHVAHNYVIVEPIREPAPISEIVPHEIERPEIETPRKKRPKVDKALIKDLKKIVEKGGGGGTVARALLHIIERLDELTYYK